MRSRNGAAVISFPARKGKLPQARMLVRHGFGVLLLDARGYDGSDGDSNVFGWGQAKDIDAAVAWLRKAAGRARRVASGGIGFSVGGEMMLEAAAGNAVLHGVVSEGAGAALDSRRSGSADRAVGWPCRKRQSRPPHSRSSAAPRRLRRSSDSSDVSPRGRSI